MSAEPVQLSIEPDETARLLQAIDVARLRVDSDRHIVFAARCWFDDKGPTFTDAQRRAVARIHEGSR